MKYVLILLGLLFCTAAQAQDALVVQTCGTNPQTYAPGATRLLTVDVNGKLCNSGGGGAGNPGGTSGQIQYNNAGSFGGFTASGDLTVNTSTGAVTFATVNSNVGSFGSATQCVAFTTNGKGLITAASQTTCTPAIASVTGLGTGVATALAIAPGTTGSFTTQDGAIVTGNCLKWGPGVQDAGAACGSGGAVSSVTGGIGITATPTTGAVVVSSPVTTRNNTATTDTITAVTPNADKGTTVTESNASAVAVAITTSGFVATDYFTVKNLGAGAATYTPSSGTINGATTLVCNQGQSSDVYFDGTNWQTLGNTCGLTGKIASGSTAMGTGAISSATCATVVTATATGVLTTDTIQASFNGDPTAVTGYVPLTAGMLTIIVYPTANTFNAKVCNNTSSSITPGAITLNWRVDR